MKFNLAGRAVGTVGTTVVLPRANQQNALGHAKTRNRKTALLRKQKGSHELSDHAREKKSDRRAPHAVETEYPRLSGTTSMTCKMTDNVGKNF